MLLLRVMGNHVPRCAIMPSITIPDSRLMIVSQSDTTTLNDIEKGLLRSDLGVTRRMMESYRDQLPENNGVRLVAKMVKF